MVTVKESLEGGKNIVPKKLDFEVFKKLGIDKEVMAKFVTIGCEKFFDRDSTTFGDFGQEILRGAAGDDQGKGIPSIYQVQDDGKGVALSPNELNGMLGINLMIC